MDVCIPGGFPRRRRRSDSVAPCGLRWSLQRARAGAGAGSAAGAARAIDERPSSRSTLSAELTELAGYLLAHLDSEEDAIFPTIRRMVDFQADMPTHAGFPGRV